MQCNIQHSCFVHKSYAASLNIVYAHTLWGLMLLLLLHHAIFPSFLGSLQDAIGMLALHACCGICIPCADTSNITYQKTSSNSMRRDNVTPSPPGTWASLADWRLCVVLQLPRHKMPA
jgi:hypothetical protein